MQASRVVFDVGGTRFVTSRATRRCDSGSLLCVMVQPGSQMRPWRVDEHNSPVSFIDRDHAHFRYILNYLRLGSILTPQSLPREQRYLYDIRAEADHFNLKGLLETIDRRISVLREANFDVPI